MRTLRCSQGPVCAGLCARDAFGSSTACMHGRGLRSTAHGSGSALLSSQLAGERVALRLCMDPRGLLRLAQATHEPLSRPAPGLARGRKKRPLCPQAAGT